MEELEELMNGVWKQLDKRNMVLYTGVAGAEMFHMSVVEYTLSNRIKHLRTKKKITQKEKISLLEMIKSPDRDNLELAKMIIEQKDGSIHY